MNTTPVILSLAPVRGITDAVYRQAFAQCFGGFDYAVAPFLHLRQGHPLRPGECRQMALENNRALRLIPQVLSSQAASLSAGLRELRDLGHDEVNWNLGCPFPTAAGRGRGAGLLPHPDKVAAILDQVFKDCPVRLSVKMRLGNRTADEFPAVLAVLNRYPLTEVILHARTAAQKYGGSVDVTRAAAAAALCRHPFVYNGDITSADVFADFRRHLPGIGRWMIGRGALANPFLPRLLRGEPLPPADNRRRLLGDFHALLWSGYQEWLSGPAHQLDKMKEHWVYLAGVFAEPQAVLSRVRACRTVDAFAAITADIFDKSLFRP